MDWMNPSGEYEGSLPSLILRGVEIFLGIALITAGGWIGVENWEAPGILNLPIIVFSVSAMLVGILLLWLAFRTYEKV